MSAHGAPPAYHAHNVASSPARHGHSTGGRLGRSRRATHDDDGTGQRSPSLRKATSPFVDSLEPLTDLIHDDLADDDAAAFKVPLLSDAAASALCLRRCCHDDDPHRDHPTGPPHATTRSLLGGDAALPLYTYEQLPRWLQCNPYIRTGYRSGYSYAQAWRSAFAVHCETGNIWSHAVAVPLFAWLAAQTQAGAMLPAAAHFWDRAVLAGYFASAVVCFAFSALFHTHYGNSHRCYVRFGCLDYTGISVLICGGATALTYTAYYDDAVWRSVYMAGSMSVGAVGVVGPTFAVWHTTRFRGWRTAIYTASGLLGCVPMAQFLATHGLPADGLGWWGRHGWAVVVLKLVCGIAFYVGKFPERWFPGRCDIVGHSHQWWHGFVSSATLAHGLLVLDLLSWRINSSSSSSAMP
ncbi:hypothetical protein H9P43_009571 [Blastocladiella emersonii ATCC 22665]|nr:hypothetical protein H9P43_009571 [Blastocladiella emersonii ATCC 22665]